MYAQIAICLLIAVSSVDMSKFAYVGTYTPPSGLGEGIYVYQIEPVSENWTLIQTVVSGSPTFLRLNDNKDRLYSVNELTEFDGEIGLVSSYSVNTTTGTLTFLTSQSSNGSSPCHLCLDDTENYLSAANYASGTVATFKLNDDGSLGDQTDLLIDVGSGPNPDRQAGPHAHMVSYVPKVNGSQNVQVVDLGIDQVIQYEFDDQTGKILNYTRTSSWDAIPGSGPRHLALRNDGRFLYVINEIVSTISVYQNKPELDIEPLQTITTLPEGWNGTSTAAEIMFHPTEKFLYGSNRGHDSIAIFSVDNSTGFLTPVGHEPTKGKTPRHFQIDGEYMYVANQDSNSISKFKMNSENGTLTSLDQMIDVPTPVCIQFA